MCRTIIIAIWIVSFIINVAINRPRPGDKGDQSIDTYIMWYVFNLILGPIAFITGSGTPLPNDSVM